METEELKNYILQKEKDDIIIFSTFSGLIEMNINDFINQPAEGILYDLNRDKATTLAFMDSPRWINDLAVASVISKLKEYHKT